MLRRKNGNQYYTYLSAKSNKSRDYPNRYLNADYPNSYLGHLDQLANPKFLVISSEAMEVLAHLRHHFAQSKA